MAGRGGVEEEESHGKAPDLQGLGMECEQSSVLIDRLELWKSLFTWRVFLHNASYFNNIHAQAYVANILSQAEA